MLADEMRGEVKNTRARLEIEAISAELGCLRIGPA